MKNKFLLLMALASLLAMISCQKEEGDEFPVEDANSLEIFQAQNGDPIEGHYIVVLNETSSKFKSAQDGSYDERIAEVKAFANSMFKTKSVSEFEVGQAYAEVMKGFSAKMSKETAAKLETDSRVKYVEQDRIYILAPWWYRWFSPAPVEPSQTTPWGITRVGYGDGTGKTAWIIDTGIDLDHSDLNVDQGRSKDFTNAWWGGANDGHGHGTHVAGTVAAINDDKGVVGVAAGATVVAVKVLDNRGSGSYSWVIAGVDYVASEASAGDAANMSLSGSASQALDDAVYTASQKGIYFALAAGNDSDDANSISPARVNGPNIWTISAMDDNDDYASFSNYGNPPVDYCEPGVSIYSCWKSNGYKTISGTSMAAPHMCGILLITDGNPKTDGYVNGDPDGDDDPIGGI